MRGELNGADREAGCSGASVASVIVLCGVVKLFFFAASSCAAEGRFAVTLSARRMRSLLAKVVLLVC